MRDALRSLESAGLLRREDTPEKGRAYQAVLTPEGFDLVQRVLPAQEAYARRTGLAGLSDDQIKQMRAIAETITANLDRQP